MKRPVMVRAVFASTWGGELDRLATVAMAVQPPLVRAGAHATRCDSEVSP